MHRETVRHEFNILRHERRVHAHERAGQRVANKLLFDAHCVLDDRVDFSRVKFILEFIHLHRKQRVQSLVARNEFVRKGETGHETALLQPVNCTERAAEEDALDARERHEAVRKRFIRVNPRERPVCLLLDARDGFDCVKVFRLLRLVLDILVDQQ